MRPSSRPPIVEMHQVTRSFRGGGGLVHALRNVSLRIESGEYLAIEGPSGCGKSTLLAMLGLLDSPDSGEYRLAGRAVATLGADARARIRGREIGFVFQAFNLLGDRTALGNVELPLLYRGLAADERDARASAALERVGLGDRSRHYPSELSGGQQQRVAVARAIAGEPKLLLADEPTGNLDSASGEAIMRLLEELHGAGTTIVMVTHDPRYAAHAARTIRMADGAILDPAG